MVSRRRGDRTWRRYIGSGTASKARGSRMRPSRLVSACMMELRATTQTARFISSKHSPAQPVHAVDGISTAHAHQQRLVEENSSSRETHLLSCRAEHGAETCHRPMPATTPPRSRDEAQSGMLKPDGRDRSPRPLIWPPDVAAAKEIRCLQARQGNATRNVTCSVHSFRRLPYIRSNQHCIQLNHVVKAIGHNHASSLLCSHLKPDQSKTKSTGQQASCQ